MDITLNQEEIEEAIADYIKVQGIDLSGKMLEVSLTAGRNGKGHTAAIAILTKNVADSSDKPEKSKIILEIPNEEIVKKKKSGVKKKTIKKTIEESGKDTESDIEEKIQEKSEETTESLFGN